MAANDKIIRNKNRKAAAVAELIAGVKKHFPNGNQEIPLEGASMTIDAVTNELQAFVNSRAAVVAAQAIAKTKIDAERDGMPAANAFVNAFTAFVKLAFRTKADVLADFGLQPPKARTPLTAEKKAVAAAKRAATREARGTKGPKAKKAVHGNITAEFVVRSGPSATTAAPATAPAAAPNGGGTTQQHS